MSSWLPQNLQKRLLLYVLQQISLFSEIDLSNVDVSLGSQSNFTFSDLNLNLEEIQIPNFSLDKGTLEHLSIQLGVAGSVNVFGEGITFELSPTEPPEDDTSEQWAASLSKSVLELTRSILGSDLNTQNTDSSTHESSTRPSTSNTTLDSMRNKVLQIALSNLSMRMRRTKVILKLIPTLTITMEISEISVNSLDSKRCIDLNGIKITSLTKSERRENISTQSGKEQELANSIHQSKYDSSIYMSALESFDESFLEAEPHVFLEVDKLSLSFCGLTSIHDLGIHDLVLKINMLRLKLEKSHLLIEPFFSLAFIGQIFENFASTDVALDLNNYKRFAHEQKIDQEMTFSALLLSRAEISLSQEISFLFDDLSLKRSDRGTTTFAISRAHLISQGKNLMATSSSTQDLFYLTCNETSSLYRIFLNNDFNILLDDNITRTIIRLVSDYSVSYQSATRKFPITRQPSTRSTIIFKSCNINLSYISDDYEIRFMFSPISSDSLSELFKVESLKVLIVENSKKTKLADICDISFARNDRCFQIRSFDTKFAEATYATKYFGSIGCISIVSSYLEIIKLVSKFNELSILLSDEFQNTFLSKPDKALKKSVRLLSSSSILHKRGFIANVAIEIKTITMALSNITNTVFEKIIIELGPVTIIQNKGNNILGVCSSVGIKNMRASGSQNIISSLKISSAKPRVIVSYQVSSKLKIYLLGLCFLYDAKWIEAVDTTSSSSEHTSVERDSALSFDLRLHDCSILMKPSRLSTAITMILPRAIINFNLPSITFSLRTVEIMLIDDYRKAKKYDLKDTTVSNIYEKQGYTKLGKLEMASLRVEMASVLKLNVKIEKIDLSLCSDSSNAFIQTLLDLKPTLTFPDNLKYQTECPTVDNSDEINDEFFNPSNLQNFGGGGSDEILSIDTDESLLLNEHHFNLNQCDGELDDIPQTIIFPACDIKLIISEANIKLYDGYDWKYTRKEITNTVNQLAQGKKDDINIESTKIFDSFYISNPRNSETDIRTAINMRIHNEEITGKMMRLRPTNKYKILIRMADMNIRFIGFHDGGVDEQNPYTFIPTSDILNKTSVNVGQLEIIDNLPTSTWNKFLFRMKNKPHYHDSPILSLEVSLVRPTTYLLATELLISVNFVPLRLHVDQDTLEFLKAFFQFKDPRFDLVEDYPDIAYIQRLEINSVELMLDYKPKKVDYVGLRSGQTKELMNFFILDGAKITLQHVILYGVEGFTELEQLLSGIWTPDITQSQLTGVISGLGPFKSLLGLGKGARALVSVPTEQYKQDGRLGRSLQKGTKVFLKTTSGEIIKLGVKLTSGAQTVLESTEEMLGGKGSSGRTVPIQLVDGDEKMDALIDESILNTTALFDTNLRNRKTHTSLLLPGDDEFRIISLYADQPKDFSTGLQDAYTSVSRSFGMAYNSMKKAREDLKDVQGAQDAAYTVAKAAPVAVIRPLIGMTEAVSKTLQGLNNQIDQGQSSDLKDKYKSQKCQRDEIA